MTIINNTIPDSQLREILGRKQLIWDTAFGTDYHGDLNHMIQQVAYQIVTERQFTNIQMMMAAEGKIGEHMYDVFWARKLDNLFKVGASSNTEKDFIKAFPYGGWVSPEEMGRILEAIIPPLGPFL